MRNLDRIITEAINNQVNLNGAKPYRDNIERLVRSIEANGNAMQNQVVADIVSYGYGIVNAYDKGNVGQRQNINNRNNTVYKGYKNYYAGNGLGYRFLRGALNDLGRAGFSQITNPMQGSLNDYIDGKNWYYRTFVNGRGGNQKVAQPRANKEVYNANTLMELLSPRERGRRWKQFLQVQQTLPANTSTDINQFFRQVEAMYLILTNRQPQQPAATMQAQQQAQQNQQQRAQTGQQPQQGVTGRTRTP